MNASETMTAFAPTSSSSPDEVDTVRAPAMLSASNSIATVPVGPASTRNLVEQIPPSPRVPFVLKPRTRQSGRWRAEVIAEWVKLSVSDSRCE